MSKTAAACFVAALVLATAATPVTPAAAVSGIAVCTTVSGTATFSPTVPKLGSKKKVVSTVTAKGVKIGGCKGKGVSIASAAFAVKFSKPGNCVTLGTGATSPLKGKMALSWNASGTSTIGQVTATALAKTPTAWKFTGTVSAGVFKGSKLSVTIVYTPANGGCEKVALKRATLKQVTSLVIK